MGINIGVYQVRRAVHIAALPKSVWHEFLDIRRLAAWFGQGHDLDHYEPGVGGRIELSVDMAGAVQGFGATSSFLKRRENYHLRKTGLVSRHGPYP